MSEHFDNSVLSLAAGRVNSMPAEFAEPFLTELAFNDPESFYRKALLEEVNRSFTPDMQKAGVSIDQVIETIIDPFLTRCSMQMGPRIRRQSVSDQLKHLLRNVDEYRRSAKYSGDDRTAAALLHIQQQLDGVLSYMAHPHTTETIVTKFATPTVALLRQKKFSFAIPLSIWSRVKTFMPRGSVYHK